MQRYADKVYSCIAPYLLELMTQQPPQSNQQFRNHNLYNTPRLRPNSRRFPGLLLRYRGKRVQSLYQFSNNKAKNGGFKEYVGDLGADRDSIRSPNTENANIHHAVTL